MYQVDEVERFKATVEYLQFLITLSTGSIVLIATFLEKLFAKHRWRPALVASLVGFMASILSSVITYTIGLYVYYPGKNANPPEWAGLLAGLLMLMTWIGFLLGIISLAIFALKNIVGKRS